MKTFKELFIEERSLPSVGMIKKQLQSLKFDMIDPSFFDIEKKSDNAGVGGQEYIKISFDADAASSTKRYSDVKLALMSITSKYDNAKVDIDKGTIIIESTQKAPAEWRVALGMIKRYFGPDQNPSEDELKDIAQEFAKKGKIEDFTAFHKWVESEISFTKEDGKKIK